MYKNIFPAKRGISWFSIQKFTKETLLFNFFIREWYVYFKVIYENYYYPCLF